MTTFSTVIRGQIDQFNTTFADNIIGNSNIAKRMFVKSVLSGSQWNHVIEFCLPVLSLPSSSTDGINCVSSVRFRIVAHLRCARVLFLGR